MIALPRRLVPRTVAGQLMSLVVGAVLLGVCLASAVMFYLIYSGGVGPSRQTLVQVRAARIAAVVNGVREARSLSEALALTRRSNTEPVYVTWARNPPSPPTVNAPRDTMAAEIDQDLQRGWRLQTLPHDFSGADANAIYVKAADGRLLRFDITPYRNLSWLLITQTLSTLGVIAFIVVFVSAWAVRWITAPLSSIASAARAFGRPGGGEGDDLDENGPIEVAQAARALNEMRKRVRRLVDERTRMLTAVSHDLRTPLTRLRLRIERLCDDPAKAAMLDEIATINEMLTETLAYMREVGQTEPASPTDLPSLLQTICAQFSDTGHDVAYRGPDRLALSCRPHALTRAVANLVDNAAKFGGRVEVRVTDGERDVTIEVSDDGPGVPPHLIAKLFEPFVKADDARAQGVSGGFGLGLSIVRDIAETHGGDVELENRAPHGLVARLRLPREPLRELAA